MPDITPRNVVFPDRWRKREGDAIHITKTTPAKLMDALNRMKAGLDAGMTPQEIREHEINKCEALIKNEAKRRVEFAANRASTAIFLRALAADIEAGIEP